MNKNKGIYLGVDGGGTKTTFLLDVNGNYYESNQITIHPMQVSKNQFYEIMELGVKEVCKKASIEPFEIDYTFVASPGYGQYPDTEKYIHDGIRTAIKCDRFKVANDCVNGWAGSLDAKAGVNLVLGTGQIGFGVDESKNTMRCGGRGAFLGDEGSGYDIGHKLLNIFTKMSDGRIEKTPLYNLVKTTLNVDVDMDIIEIAENMKREEVASISKILEILLNEDEKYSHEILNRIAYESALVIDAIIDQLDFKGKVDVSYSGGVFNLGDIVLNKIKDNIKNNIEIITPLHSPHEGSVILAKKFFRNENFINLNLKSKQYNIER